MELTNEELEKLRGAIPGLLDVVGKHTHILGELAAVKAQLGGVSIPEMKEAVDKSVASMESLQDSIRKSRGGLHFSGVEDAAKGFSLMRAIRAIRTRNWDDAGHEKAVMDEARRKHGETIMKTVGAITTMIGSEGGNFVPDQVLPDVIGPVYARSVFIAMPGAEGTSRIRVVDGLVGSPVKIPKYQGGMTASWTGEAEAYTASQPTTAMVSMSPKKLTILAKLSEEMLRAPGLGFERLLREDMVRVIASKLDYTIAFGAGTDNEPRGLAKHPGIQFFDSTSGAIVTAPPAAASNLGAEPTFDHLTDIMGAIEDANLSLDPSFAFITNPRVIRRLKKLKLDSYSGQTTNRGYLLGPPVISDAKLRDLIGFDIAGSTQFPSNHLPGQAVPNWTTTSTTEKFSYMFGGNWAEVILGRWFGLEILDDGGVSRFSEDLTLVKARMWADLAVRQEAGIVLDTNVRARD